MADTGAAQKIRILDGGMSRELMGLGAPFKQPEWSAQALIEAPEYVKQVHSAFIAAGSNIITTDSYALVPFHIGEDRFWREGERLAALSGKLAREAADEEQKRSGKRILVAGSLPPIFGSYRPDLFDAAEVQKYLAVLVRGLAPYVDVWLGETLSVIAEADAVLTATKDSDKEVWIAFTLDDSDGAAKATPKLRSGETVDAAANRLTELGVKTLLFNCCQPECMEAAVKEAKKALDAKTSDYRLGVYANAFEAMPAEYAANEGISATRQDLQPELYLRFAKRWVASGASIIGGCCGIGCKYIESLAQALGETTA